MDQVVEQSVDALTVVKFIGQGLLFSGAPCTNDGRQTGVTEEVGEPLFQGLHGSWGLEPLTLFFRTVDVKVKVKLVFISAR